MTEIILVPVPRLKQQKDLVGTKQIKHICQSFIFSNFLFFLKSDLSYLAMFSRIQDGFEWKLILGTSHPKLTTLKVPHQIEVVYSNNFFKTGMQTLDMLNTRSTISDNQTNIYCHDVQNYNRSILCKKSGLRN